MGVARSQAKAVQESKRTAEPSRTDDARPHKPQGRARRQAQALLEQADIRLDGARPWDIQVHDERLFRRVLLQGSLGLGEAYMDGWWDVERPDAFFHRVLAARLDRQFAVKLPILREAAVGLVRNMQRGARAFRIGEHHYDIGNELYADMLDDRMVYSCGYWKDATDLDAAQEAKLDLVCRKLGLGPGMRVLDIGCGWGSFLQFAAERYGVDGVGVTVSKEQLEAARARCAGLPVDLRLQDYRAIDDGPFDRVVSIGMFEHVGHKNHRTFMAHTHRLLDDDGLQLLHTIGRPRSGIVTDPWISRYIFPNSMLPSMKQIADAADDRFVIEDVHNFGQDYDPTLMAWWHRFDMAWPALEATKPRYDERFYRMWKYYLLSSAGAFRARTLQVWQVVMAKDKGVDGGYVPVR